jgi:hypothetical protein
MTENARIDTREWFAVCRLYCPSRHTGTRAEWLLGRVWIMRAFKQAECTIGTYRDFE